MTCKQLGIRCMGIPVSGAWRVRIPVRVGVANLIPLDIVANRGTGIPEVCQTRP